MDRLPETANPCPSCSHLDWKEGTEDVHALLRDLAQSQWLWRQFIENPHEVAGHYGLLMPERLGFKKGRGLRRPFASLFSREPSWSSWSPTSSEARAPLELYQCEIVPTLSGAKPTSRLMVKDDCLAATLNYLEQKRMPVVLSPYKEIAEPNRNARGFADRRNLCVPIDAQMPGVIMVYISRDRRQAQTAAVLEALGADEEFGRSLGYPECCTEYFGQCLSGSSERDYVSRSIQNTDRPPPYSFFVNNAARHFGVRLIHHFPCSYNCEPSIALGRRYLVSLNAESPDLAFQTQARLLHPVIYSEAGGTFLLEETQIGSSLVYNPDRIRGTTVATSLYRVIRTADRIEVQDWRGGRLSFYRGNRPVCEAIEAWCLTFTEDCGFTSKAS